MQNDNKLSSSRDIEDLEWYADEHLWLVEEIMQLKEELSNCQQLLAGARAHNATVQTKVTKLNRELNEYREDKNKAFNHFSNKLEQALNDRDEYRKRWEDADDIIQTFMRRNRP